MKKVRTLAPSAGSALQGDLFGRAAPRAEAEAEELAPPTPSAAEDRPSSSGGAASSAPLPPVVPPLVVVEATRPAPPQRAPVAGAPEIARVDLEPARVRERGVAARWTSTTEVVRIEAPGAGPVRAPERTVLTVSQLTQAVKGTLVEGFRRILVRGEVSNFRGAHASGHLFFKLKDAGASIDVKIWASVVQRLRFRLEEGMEVIAEGALDVYEKAGQYNLIVQRIEPSGAGALALAFAQLRERLTAEGLMGERRIRPPRPLPFLPRRIGVVTSRSGAALHDFLRVLHRRNSGLSILLCHARVQGPGATDEVVRALKRLARTDVDVIVVTRGGGSAEDLWTFNEEAVARAIAASPVPVVSAVGHEVDFTIADFVADARAATPSAAAEMLAPELESLEDGLRAARSRLRHAVAGAVSRSRERLGRQELRLPDPRRAVSSLRHEIVERERVLGRLWSGRLRLERGRLLSLRLRLERFRPETLLAERHARLDRLRWRLAEAQRARLVGLDAALQRHRQRVERRNPGAELSRARRRLDGLEQRLGRKGEEQLALAHRRVADAGARITRAIRTGLTSARSAARVRAERLDGLSPLRVMARGYAVVYRSDDSHLVRRADELRPGVAVRLRWAPSGCASLEQCDEAEATITRVKPGADEE